MARFNRLGTLLLATTASLALAGCNGADGVASPGEGVIVVPGTPTPTPSTPTPTPTAPGTPAASCPVPLGLVVTKGGRLDPFAHHKSNSALPQMSSRLQQHGHVPQVPSPQLKSSAA